jgi:hypothetical protein
MRKPLIVLGVLLVLLAVSMAPASATKPLDVELDMTTFFAKPPDLATGFFTASGDAVDAGVMCPAGTKADLFPEKWAGNSGTITNGQVITEFTCTEGPLAGDRFTIKLQLHIDARNPYWTINWTVKGGTGAFADLHGSGNGMGSLYFVPEFPFPIGALDVLDGGLHID